MKMWSTFFQAVSKSPFVLAFQTRSLSSQYSSSSPTLEGAQYLSRVSGSVSAMNHLGRCGGILPSSLALLVALCFSSCFDFNSFARSYLPNSNARWSGRSLQSVGQMKGLSVSSGQSFNVMAKGVRLNGATGFSEFFQSKIFCVIDWPIHPCPGRGIFPRTDGASDELFRPLSGNFVDLFAGAGDHKS
jgi:hypothetical protein